MPSKAKDYSEAMDPPRLSRNRIWGLGIYINPDSYRYVALQCGPLWLYLWHEAWRKT